METSPSGEASAPVAVDPRDVVPATAADYALNLDDGQRAALAINEGDPLVSGLGEWAAEQGWSQGRVDDVLAAAAALSAKGLLGAPFDPAAETARLGENGSGRQREVEIFAGALKDRGELTDGEHSVLLGLGAEADGVTLIEKLRGRMGDAGRIEAPQDAGGGTSHEALLAKARDMRADPRYDTDKAFRKAADDAWQAAYRAKK